MSSSISKLWFYLFFWGVCTVSVVLKAQNYDEYDCRVGRSDISFIDVFEQLAQGLDYTEDGVIVSVEGKRLQLSPATKIAFFHYVARNHPTVMAKKLTRCSSCNGKGGTNRHNEFSPNGLSLGTIVEGVKCSSCNGSGFFVDYVRLTVIYSGELPPLEESPRSKEYRRKLYQAQDGDAQAQYEVGILYRTGKGFKRDLNLARDWLTKSAIQGESRAIPELAELYCDQSFPCYDRAFGLSLFYASGKTNLHDLKKNPASGVLREVTGASKLAALQDYLDEMQAMVLGPRIKQGLNSKEEISKLLDPESARKSFAAVKDEILPDGKDSGIFITKGICKYFGLGYSQPSKDEGLNLIEVAASKSNPQALMMIALHFDAGVFYAQSDSTAWSYYYAAKKMGYSDEYCTARIDSLEHSDVGVDWSGYPEIVFQYLKSGKLDSTFIRRSHDLSICRFLLRANQALVTSSTSNHNSNVNFPISDTQGIEFAKNLIKNKYNQSEFFNQDGFLCKKNIGTDNIFYYTITGVVTKLNRIGLPVPSTFIVLFKVSSSTDSPTLVYCSTFGSTEGSMNIQTLITN
jgi:TPR repeat protein